MAGSELVEDIFYEGPEWAPYTELGSVKRRVAIRRARDLNPRLTVGLDTRKRYRSNDEAKLLELSNELLDAADRLDLPDHVASTALQMVEATYRNYIWRHGAYIAAVLRGATILHAWPKYYWEILDALDLNDKEGRILVGRYQIKLSTWIPSLWPKPVHWRAMARALAQRLAGEIGLSWRATREASDLAEYIVARRDGTRIETAAAAAVIVAARRDGRNISREEAAERVGVSGPTVSKAVKWLQREMARGAPDAWASPDG